MLVIYMGWVIQRTRKAKGMDPSSWKRISGLLTPLKLIQSRKNRNSGLLSYLHEEPLEVNANDRVRLSMILSKNGEVNLVRETPRRRHK